MLRPLLKGGWEGVALVWLQQPKSKTPPQPSPSTKGREKTITPPPAKGETNRFLPLFKGEIERGSLWLWLWLWLQRPKAQEQNPTPTLPFN